MSDAVVKVRITGDPASFIASVRESAAATEVATAKMDAATDGFATRTGGLFSKLGSSMNSFGIPFGNNVDNMGKKMGEASVSGEGMASALAGPVAMGVGGLALVAGGVAVAAMDMADKFDTATSKIAANAGITQAQAKKISDAFLTTAGDSTFSATQMAQAYAPVAAQLASVQGHGFRQQPGWP